MSVTFYNIDETNGTATAIMMVEQMEDHLHEGNTPIKVEIDLDDPLVAETFNQLIVRITEGQTEGTARLYLNGTAIDADETVWMPLYAELSDLLIARDLIPYM